jgi:O-antigen/teichoic acid export membrane protein
MSLRRRFKSYVGLSSTMSKVRKLLTDFNLTPVNKLVESLNAGDLPIVDMAILFIPSWLGQVILPLLSNLNAESTLQQYRKVLRLSVFLNAGIALAVVLPIVLFAHLVMSAYGPGFERGVSVLRVLAFTAVLMAITNVIGLVIASKNKMWVRFTFNALWAIVLLTTTSILLQRGYGAMGLACATFIAYFFHASWHGLYIRRECLS